MTYKSILNSFLAARSSERQAREDIRTEMTRTKARAMHYAGIIARKMTRYHKLEAEADACDKVRFTTHLVTPLMAEVTRLTGIPFDLGDLRTYGLRAECPVFTTEEEGDKERRMMLCFTFDNREGRLYLDTGEKSHACQPGSIAEINGMDNRTEEVTDVMTVIANLQRRYPEYDIKVIGKD